MRRALRSSVWIVIAAALCAVSLAGHGLDIEVGLHPPTVVLRAAYSGAEAVAYASVRIHAPGPETAEFQIGRADAAGRFAFVPDREGPWRIIVDDERGHRAERRIEIGPEFFAEGGPAVGAAGPHRSRLPAWLGALVGIALIFGASGFLYGFRVRRAARS